MRRLFFVMSLSLLSLHTVQAAPLCPSVDLLGLKKEIENEKSTTLLFFSTWCLSCRERLLELASGELKNHVAVATFDSVERVEASLKRMSFKGRCFFSLDTARFFGVKTVPARREVNVSDFDHVAFEE